MCLGRLGAPLRGLGIWDDLGRLGSDLGRLWDDFRSLWSDLGLLREDPGHLMEPLGSSDAVVGASRGGQGSPTESQGSSDAVASGFVNRDSLKGASRACEQLQRSINFPSRGQLRASLLLIYLTFW